MNLKKNCSIYIKKYKMMLDNHDTKQNYLIGPIYQLGSNYWSKKQHKIYNKISDEILLK